MLIIVPTIYHTGTHLLIHHVFPRSFAHRRKNGGHYLRHFHLERTFDQMDIGGDFRFSTLRHPRRVAESWVRRQYRCPQRTMEEFNYEWGHMINFYSPHIDAYLHPDHENRDDDVARMASLTGLDLSCDWPLNKRSGSKHATHDIDINECPEVPQEFIDFYYETVQ